MASQQRAARSDSESSVDESELHPLFWSKIPENVSEETQMYLDTFQKMIYDGKSEDELALNFKERGDDIFRQGKAFYDDALIKYSQALTHSSAGSPSEANRTVYVGILANRAELHLRRGNYRSCYLDCAAALKYGAAFLKNPKVYYRGGKACSKVEKWTKGLRDFVRPGLERFPDAEPLMGLREELQAGHTEAKRKRDARDRKEWMRKKEDKAARAALPAGLTYGPLYRDCEALVGLESGATPLRVVQALYLGRPGANANATLPFLVLYPEFNRSDFLKEVELSAELTWEDVLKAVIPLPPDYGPHAATAYDAPEAVACYVLRSRAPASASTFDLNKALYHMENRNTYVPDLYQDCDRVEVQRAEAVAKQLVQNCVHMVVAVEVVSKKSTKFHAAYVANRTILSS